MGNRGSANKFDRLPTDLLRIVFTYVVEASDYKTVKHLTKISRANKRIFLLTKTIWESIYREKISRQLPIARQRIRLNLPHEYIQIRHLSDICISNFKDIQVMAVNDLMITAAGRGCEIMLENAIASGADVKYNRNGALKRAFMFNRPQIAECLIEHGADIKACNRELNQAFSIGHLWVVKFFVDHGYLLDVNLWFLASVTKGSIEFVKYFLSLGADIQYDRNAALIEAISEHEYEIVVYLVEHGADPRARNDRPIIKAYIKGYRRTVQYLQSRGADINVAKRAKAKRDKKKKREELVWQQRSTV